MINPAKLLQIKSSWTTFSKNHPKFVNFLSAMGKDGVKEGTVVEVTVIDPDGKKTGSNIKLLQSDIDFIQTITDMTK